MRSRAGASRRMGASRMCIHWADAVKRIGAAAVASMLALGVVHAQGYPSKFEFGQPASEQEIAAIAIAIPADGKGLPSGQGDYARGKQVYETACAACHGADLMGVAKIGRASCRERVEI